MIALSFLRKRLSRVSPARAALIAAVAAFVLTSTSLLVGMVTDDYCWSAVFQGVPGLPEITNATLDTFSFATGDPQQHARYLAKGIVPWWTDPHWRINFFRPLSSLSHFADFVICRDHVWLMHLHSMLLYAVLAFAVTRLYQRHLQPAWAAALAGLLFAVDSAHGLSVGWLSNRNAILSALFAVLVLLAHDRWRTRGQRVHLLLAGFCLFTGLLCGEGTVAVLGYLVAYAVFLEEGSWRRRLLSVIPYLVIVAVWRVYYSANGYGVTASSFYTDPVSDPAGFFKNSIKFLPILLYSQFAFPDPIYQVFLPHFWGLAYVFLAAMTVCGLAWLFWPLLRREAAARFYAAGMVLAAVPFCSSTPQYRLLMIIGIGGVGVLAMFFAGREEKASWCPDTGLYARLTRPLTLVLVVLHLVVAPIMLPGNAYSMRYVGKAVDLGNDTLPSGPEITHDRVIILNATGDIVYAMLPIMRSALGENIPKSLWVLYSGNKEMHVDRTDARSLDVTVEDGWMDYPRSFLFCRLPESAMTEGQTIQTEGLLVKVLRVNEEGRPTRAEFRFDRPLEDPSLRWFTWHGDGYRPFTLPPVGGQATIPGLSIPEMIRQVVESQVSAVKSRLAGSPAPGA